MPSEFDPVEYARFAERLTGAMTVFKDEFSGLREEFRDFSGRVLERFMSNERESALNDQARRKLDTLGTEFEAHRREVENLKSSFKAWLSVGIGLSTLVGGVIGNWISQHLK